MNVDGMTVFPARGGRSIGARIEIAMARRIIEGEKALMAAKPRNGGEPANIELC